MQSKVSENSKLKIGYFDFIKLAMICFCLIVFKPKPNEKNELEIKTKKIG